MVLGNARNALEGLGIDEDMAFLLLGLTLVLTFLSDVSDTSDKYTACTVCI